ncbi:macro domain-containing protein [Desulfurispira natronophila]|uniref:O-acetyl-ADP-ribose deacetylase (Regulator of RNase III) n=1 Tax=Desulfurispira natronophila TaxID=682562 RepID=A0A7W8DG20_9BACT|nr:macro domain-containing protein [Desulfurispira natronophila]MBB5020940.1 O-acetyl-ADP-ribose deacetylase (regulator of RNase III) [Desulfurispira natronophila]
MPVIVKQGNLLTEPDATFILNASNTVLSLGSGVSAAFREHCGGEEYQAYLNQVRRKHEAEHGPVKQGEVIVSGPGQANNFLYAFHAAVMDYSRGRSRPPQMTTLVDILNNINQHLSRFVPKLRSEDPQRAIKLVLPLMGTGVGGLEARKVLDKYRTFLPEMASRYDMDIVVYGYHREDFLLVRAMLQGRAGKEA